MRIAFFGVGILPAPDSSGIPAFHAALRELSKTHEVTVYSFIPVYKSQLGLKIRCVPSKKLRQSLQYFYLGFFFILDHVSRRFDIVHAQSPFPSGVIARILCKIFRLPWLLSFHAGEAVYMPEIPYGDLVNPFLKRINTQITQQAPTLVAMSHHQADMIKKNLEVNKSITVLPRGIVVPNIKPKVFKDDWTFLHVSYNQPVKNTTLLLNTFKLLSEQINCHLFIAGANYQGDFFNLIKQFNLQERVTLLGAVDHPEVLSKMDSSDFLIHTSICEALPMVALEAMSRGVVVCGTRVGIMADLSPEFCITVEDNDASSLATEIIRICEKPDDYIAIRIKAWQWVRDHDMDWYIKELLACYQKTIAQK
jgi:glycosyltransferase involved in cell wall biosynthesis